MSNTLEDLDKKIADAIADSDRKIERNDERRYYGEPLSKEEIADMKREDRILDSLDYEDDRRGSTEPIVRRRPSKGARDDHKGRFTNRPGKPRW